MKIVITLLLMTGLFACSKSIDIKLEPEVYLVLSQDAKQRIYINEKDEAYVTLSQWLDDNKDGWYATSGHYSGGVYVKSGEYGVLITDLKVIIYSTLGKAPKAIYAKNINRGELGTLLNFSK
ncbi:hypothetical protein [Thalassotalea profundi]|uniref:Uncharacterized protein n=1 Tax=Thalassotalea profundi TaxID=2036687 RepID=A0ABQ3IJF5_9GAMM|nr:hypothetical protein [Thalassotalea profundi]GHE85486.1 hypothetical protein GCM10011501_13170 [Thalassotalea profundi]